jgi:hypothetical protein
VVYKLPSRATNLAPQEENAKKKLKFYRTTFPIFKFYDIDWSLFCYEIINQKKSHKLKTGYNFVLKSSGAEALQKNNTKVTKHRKNSIILLFFIL